jgi:hypothetical protein
MVNPRKAFPMDPGLILVFERTGRANLGHALETVVLVELERRRMEATYVRTPGGYEVDFPDGREGVTGHRAPSSFRLCAGGAPPSQPVAYRSARPLAARTTATVRFGVRFSTFGSGLVLGFRFSALGPIARLSASI